MKSFVQVLAVLMVFTLSMFGQTAQKSPDTEESAIRATAMDYIEGYYEGNAERMERALHPDLAKRTVRNDPQGRSSLGQMSALTLVQIVRRGEGRNIPADKQQKDFTLLDRFENSAMVKVVAKDWVDYMQLAKWNGQWKIVNVLWEMKPQK